MPDTRNGTTPLASLSVDRKQFATALRLLTRNVKLAKAGEAILRFVEGDLVIQIGGAKVSARARGRWPGEARLLGRFLLGAAVALPACDPIPIRVEAKRLYLDRISIRCVWQRLGAARIEIPIEATVGMIARIGREQSREEIEASGLGSVVDAALRQENELIERAAAILAQLGVTEEEVRRMATTRAG
jgi:hypothetical protein